MRDFQLLFWATYRRGMPAIPGASSHTTDSGWGCMIRSEEMLIAHALQRALLSDGNVHVHVHQYFETYNLSMLQVLLCVLG